MTIKTIEKLIFTILLIYNMSHKINEQLLQYIKFLNIIFFNDKKVVIIKNLKWNWNSIYHIKIMSKNRTAKFKWKIIKWRSEIRRVNAWLSE